MIFRELQQHFVKFAKSIQNKADYKDFFVISGLVFIGTILGKLTGLIRDLMVADIYGAGYISDAFFVASLLPMLLVTISDYLFNVPFVKVLSGYFKIDPLDAWNVASSIAFFLLTICILCVIASLTYRHQLINIIGPDLSFETKLLATKMLYVSLPAMIPFVICGFFKGLLQSFQDYFAQSFTVFIFNASFIFLLIILGNFEKPMLLVWALFIGALFQVIIQIPSVLIKKPKFSSSSLMINHPKLKEFCNLAGMIVFAGVLSRIGEGINRIMASSLPEGGISALYYGLRIAEIPVSLVASSVLVVTFPKLVLFISSKNRQDAERLIWLSFACIILVASLANVVFLSFGFQIIHLLFEHGKFNSNDTLRTTEVLYYYSPGMIALGGYMLFSQLCYAIGKSRFVLTAAFVGLIINISANLILIGPMAHKGLALSTSLSFFGMLFTIVYLLIKTKSWRLTFYNK